MFNASKQLFRVLALPILTIPLILSSCLKEVEYNVVGEWVVFPKMVKVLIIDDQNIDEQTELTIKTSKEAAEEELRKLERIIFHPKDPSSETGVVEFYYADNTNPTEHLSGTYQQTGAYFTIWNSTFPDGILGLCNNHELEIYYPREYIQRILLNKGLDMQIIVNFLDLMGVGHYLRSE